MAAERVFWFVAVVVVVSCYPGYKNKIPNGNSVPNPCNSTSTWLGVGHQVPNGGGTRNPFGIAFANEGRSWTNDLCTMDSDGDGMSNGAELGDVNCTWTIGSTPSSTSGLSHPGICEPLDAAMCVVKNNFTVCP